MNGLFERRELVRNIHIDARFLQRNVHAALLAQLKTKYEGMCGSEGYINKGSVTVIEHSLGRTNLIKGGIDYTVKFQADICMPHPGQKITAPITLKSKIGVHAETVPVRALLPRDLHIGNEDFEKLEPGQAIEFTVVGARFQQGDDHIVILGQLESVQAPAPGPTAEQEAEVVEPAQDAAEEGSASEKRVVTIAPTQTRTDAPRKRLMKVSNEPASKGGAQGEH